MFKLYIVNHGELTVSGLDCYQNVYNFPEDFKQMKDNRPHGWMSVNQIDFIVNLNPELVENDELLGAYFRSKSEVNIGRPDGFPHCATVEYQKAIKPWLELMRNQESPFRWVPRTPNSNCMDAIAENNIAIAHAAISWWKETIHQYQVKREIHSLEQKISILKNQIEETRIDL